MILESRTNLTTFMFLYIGTILDRSYFFEIDVYNISLYQPNTLSLENRSILGLIVFPGKDDVIL